MANPAPEVLRPLRRKEYDQLVTLGAFQHEKIELLDGSLVAMSPIGAPHNSAVQKLTELLLPALLGRATVRCQMSLAAGDLSEPVPDVAVVPVDDYDQDHPHEAYLVIEVAESSLATDRGRKLRLYARCGVPEYWIVDSTERCIEVYTEAGSDSYARIEKYERGQAIRLSAFSDIEVRVSDILK